MPVLDAFQSALKSAENAKDFLAFHDGILLIEKQFLDLLERKWGLKRFTSVGEEFDPQRHEALSSETVPGQDSMMVLEDYMTGYTLYDKVLRAAKVKISMPVTAKTDGAQSAETPSETPKGTG